MSNNNINNNINKNRNNYNKMYDAGKRIDVNPVDEVIPAEVKDEVMDVIADVAVKMEKPVEKPVIGKVTCEFLNVRSAPFKDAQPPVEVIPKDSEVTINLKESVNDWYKVTVNKSGAIGFCMKKFIAVR